MQLSKTLVDVVGSTVGVPDYSRKTVALPLAGPGHFLQRVHFLIFSSLANTQRTLLDWETTKLPHMVLILREL